MHGKLKDFVESGVVGHIFATTPVSMIFTKEFDGNVKKHVIVPRCVTEEKLVENIIASLSSISQQKSIPVENNFAVEYNGFTFWVGTEQLDKPITVVQYNNRFAIFENPYYSNI